MIWFRDPGSAPAVSLPRRLRDRVALAGPADGSEAQHLARAQVAVAASAGTAPAPQLVLRALAGGAVPVVSRLPQYEEALRDGELGAAASSPVTPSPSPASSSGCSPSRGSRRFAGRIEAH